MSDILFSELTGKAGDIGLITLNRPRALNALTYEMIAALSKQLKAWEITRHIKAVIIRSSNTKAFCAGGDIRQIYEAGLRNKNQAVAFFKLEYQLNYLIARYAKPYIALLNGITMGGGAGISLHGTLRLASPNLIWAMPETGIGFFPDVGASYFLSRCPGAIGMYLGLTGAKITAADAIMSRLIDEIVAEHRFEQLIQAIADDAQLRPKNIAEIAAPFKTPAHSHLTLNFDSIIKHFSKTSVSEILNSLQQDHSAFAQQTYTTLISRSPLSLRVTFETIQRGKQLDLAACLAMEYQVMQQFLLTADLYEGIRAAVIDKDLSPRWQPKQLAEVSDAQVAAFFTQKDKLQLEIH